MINIKYFINVTINMKIQRMKSGQHFITLPNMIVKAKQWKKGDDLKVEINEEGNIVLRK